MFEATKLWLKDRLGLEISPEKSKIVNLKRHYSEFLGFKLKVRKKGKNKQGQPKYVVEAHIKEKKLAKIKAYSKEIIGKIRQTYNTGMEYKLVQMYNSYLIGVHNYYCIATHVNMDFQEIAYDVKKSLYNRLKHRITKKGTITNGYIRKQYGTSREVRFIGGHAIVPIAYVQHRVPMDKKRSINKYTPQGREEIHKNLECVNIDVLHYLMNNPCGTESVEYNDTKEQCIERVQALCQQNRPQGYCALTIEELFTEWHRTILHRVKESTAANYTMKANKHILPAFGKMMVSSLTANHIYDFITEKQKAGFSSRYIADTAQKLILEFKNVFYNIDQRMLQIVFCPVQNNYSPLESEQIFTFLRELVTNAVVQRFRDCNHFRDNCIKHILRVADRIENTLRTVCFIFLPFEIHIGDRNRFCIGDIKLPRILELRFPCICCKRSLVLRRRFIPQQINRIIVRHICRTELKCVDLVSKLTLFRIDRCFKQALCYGDFLRNILTECDRCRIRLLLGIVVLRGNAGQNDKQRHEQIQHKPDYKHNPCGGGDQNGSRMHNQTLQHIYRSFCRMNRLPSSISSRLDNALAFLRSIISEPDTFRSVIGCVIPVDCPHVSSPPSALRRISW